MNARARATLTLTLLLVAAGNHAGNIRGDDKAERGFAGMRNSSSSISVLWGVPDAVTSVGRVFRYRLPEDAFKGSVAKIEIVQAGGAGLPAWLHFDDVAWTFVGVPSEQDVGHHYLLVTATGPAGDQAKDVFDVEVTHTDQELHAAPMDSGAPCEPGDAASVLTVVLDADLHAMAPRERVAVVERVQQYVNVARDRVRLRAVADDQKLFDSAAVMAGPGNARKPAHGGVFVSWQVGCGKNPSVYSIPGLSHIEVSSQDGRLADHIGYPVIGWHVASRKVTQGKRLRRQVWLQATATAGVAVPTPATPYTTRTMTDREPMTSRVIPSMASPTAEETQVMPDGPTEKVTATDTRSAQIEPSPTMPVMPATTPPTEAYTPELPTIVEATTEWPEAPSTETTEATSAVTDTTAEEAETEAVNATMMASSTESAANATEFTFFTYGPTTEAVATTLKPRKEKTKKPGGPTKQPKARPSAAQPMKDLQAMQGEVFVFRVPARTFDDGAGGGTRQLSLSLLSRDRSPIPDDSWLTFNATSQTMSGLPLKALVRAPSVAKYHLVAENSDGRTASVKVTIEVVPRPSDEEFANHFAVAIDDDYDKFSRDPAKQRAFLGRLAAAFGDDDASQVALTSLTPGSTIVAWSNSSQSANECDEEAAKAVAGRMLDDDGNIREEFLEAMKPFVVAAASFAPGGDCVGKVEPLGVAPVPSGAAAASPDDDDKEEEEEVKEEEEVEKEEEDAVLLSTIIPVVVIAVLVVVAVLIACVLCRRRRRQKGYTKAATDDRDALRKHTPVILSGETDDAEMDRTAAASSPGATERQPRPPPEYHAMTDVPPPPPHGYRNGRGQQQQQQQAYDQRYA